jgi:holo-[acyl-carrier protein] synthase
VAAVVLGIGIDVVELPRFASAAERFGERLAQRLFTPGERAYAAARQRAGESLAVRFAAKCAARRALAAPRSLGWHEIEVVREAGRAPELRFHGEAERRARALGVERAALSLSHDRSACIAQVVLEGRA